jgi:hypothetical protein
MGADNVFLDSIEGRSIVLREDAIVEDDDDDVSRWSSDSKGFPS